jgi:hypothetical protein
VPAAALQTVPCARAHARGAGGQGWRRYRRAGKTRYGVAQPRRGSCRAPGTPPAKVGPAQLWPRPLPSESRSGHNGAMPCAAALRLARLLARLGYRVRLRRHRPRWGLPFCNRCKSLPAVENCTSERPIMRGFLRLTAENFSAKMYFLASSHKEARLRARMRLSTTSSTASLMVAISAPRRCR